MLANLGIVLPIFALILTGFIARRSGALGPNATKEVNRFVVYLALPALVFDIMAKASLSEVWLPGFIIAFGIGGLIVFVFTLWLRMKQGAHMSDGAIDGLNTGYANTGFIGIPLVLAALGQSAMGATVVANILTVCILFALALVLIEVSLQEAASPAEVCKKTLLSLIKNPLVISPLAGAVFMCTGLPLPKPVDTYLQLLGGAASPCALVALGLFLADNASRKPRAGIGVQWTLVALKLIVHPLITWIIAVPILHLDPLLAHTAVLIAALPTGTGPFMLAEFYGREALLTGRVMLITTVLSIFTLSLYLATIR